MGGDKFWDTFKGSNFDRMMLGKRDVELAVKLGDPFIASRSDGAGALEETGLGLPLHGSGRWLLDKHRPVVES
jgi:hypothetical protein